MSGEVDDGCGEVDGSDNVGGSSEVGTAMSELGERGPKLSA